MIEAIVVGEQGGRLVLTQQRVLSWLRRYGTLLRLGTVGHNAEDQNNGKCAAF